MPDIKHEEKHGRRAPWRCIATAEFQSRRKKAKKKTTLLLLTPASHFGLQRFQSARGAVSAVFREMTCLRTNTAMFCSSRALSIPSHSLLNPFLPRASDSQTDVSLHTHTNGILFGYLSMWKQTWRWGGHARRTAERETCRFVCSPTRVEHRKLVDTTHN